MYLPGRKQKSKPLGRYRKHLKCNFEAKHGSTHLPSGGLGRCTSLDSGRARMHPRAGSVVVLSKLQKPSLSCTLPPFQLWTPLPHSSDRSIICKAFLSFLPPPSLPALSQSSDFFEASSEELWMLAQYCRGMECLQCRVSLVVWSYDSGFLITAFDCLYTQLPPPPPHLLMGKNVVPERTTVGLAGLAFECCNVCSDIDGFAACIPAIPLLATMFITRLNSRPTFCFKTCSICLSHCASPWVHSWQSTLSSSAIFLPNMVLSADLSIFKTLKRHCLVPHQSKINFSWGAVVFRNVNEKKF